MKKIAFVSAVMTLFATSAAADTFGRNTDNFAGSVLYSHDFSNSENLLTGTVGGAYSIGVVKLYTNTGYEFVNEEWNGVNLGATTNFGAASNMFVDGWVNLNSGDTVANVEVGLNF